MYLFLDFFWDKMWLWSFFALLFFAIGFLVFAIKGIVKKEKCVSHVIAAVVLIIVGAKVVKSETFKSPVVLAATLNDDLSFIDLRLRENKTFEVDVATMFGNEIFTGKYDIQGDKLIFLNKPYSNDFIPDTLTIGRDKIYFQFDSTRKPLSNFAAFFTISQNKLKKSL